MVIAAKALLDKTPQPSEAQVKQALNGHLCRCASHNRIVRAVQRAARAMIAGAAGANSDRSPGDDRHAAASEPV